MLTAPANAVTNLIINGSFETPYVPPGLPGPTGGWEVFYAPTPGLGWIPVTANGMEIQNHVVGANGEAWDAYHGDQLAEVDTYGNGGMYQNVNTISWQQYNLSFAFSPRPGLILPSSGIEVYWNDALIAAYWTSGVGLTNTVWSISNNLVTATGVSSTLRFMATGTSDGLGSLIDDVKLSPVPEPSTLLLLGSGLVGLVGFGKKKIRK